MNRLFTAAVPFTGNAQAATLRPGQWVYLESGARGQFLGVTRAGVTVIRWQHGKFGTQGATPQTDARQNRTLRTYAKVYGAR